MEGENYKLFRTLAGAPRTVRGRPSAINVHPSGKTFLYCNGNSVFIRDLEDPSECDVYTQHARETTCAAYAPSGYYICSGDASGKIRIWDTINKEHILKYEYPVLGGAIKDIVWSEDSKRIAVCGDGKEDCAKVINWDTGTTCGSLHGASKSCNNIAYKQNRPYRIVVASEDMGTYYFEGIPFKMKQQIYEHSNFVNCVRFSPDGNKFATAGADGRCFIHDGKDGNLQCELCEPAKKIHNGGIYGIAWSPDNKHLMTASADKTVKIWVMDEDYHQSNKEAVVIKIGDEIGDMQVGCAWTGTTLLSISLNGNINYLDANDKNVGRVLKGHVKAIVTSVLSADKNTLFTASFDGLVYWWDLRKGTGELVTGTGHKSQVQNMCRSGDNLITCGMDDTVRFISVNDKKFIDSKIIQLDSQPQRVYAGKDDIAVVACLGQLIVLKDDKIIHTTKIKQYEPSCVAVSSCLNKVAVGTDHSKVLLFDMVDNAGVITLKDAGSIPTNGNVTDVKFSPDKSYLGMCTGKKQVKVVDTTTFEVEKLNQATHAVKVNNIAWTPNSRYITSCGIDGHVYTYSIESGDKVVAMRGAHAQSVDVTSVQWSSDTELLTTGRQDCSVRMWNVVF